MATSNVFWLDILHWAGRTISDAQRPVPKGLMRTVLVVVLHIGLHDVVQLPQVEAEHQVQALPFEASDPRLRKTIGDGSAIRRQHRTAPVPPEVLVKRCRELRIVVVDEEPNVDAFFLSPDADVSGLLLHPLIGWV